MTPRALAARIVALTIVLAMIASPALADPGNGGGLSIGLQIPGLIDLSASVSASESLAWGDGGSSTSMRGQDVARAIRSHNVTATGEGVGVALIDTGVAPVAGLEDVVHGPDLSLNAPIEPWRHLDAYGHGTHLAGLITSDRPDALGIAPGADVISIKAGAANGAVDVSQVIAAIGWVTEHADSHGIRVLVLAYGTDSVQPAQIDPLAHAVQSAWRQGIVVVASAGNHAAHRDRVSHPGIDPYIITVGAADTRGTTSPLDDRLAAFSAPGDASRRPDLVAPGVGLVSAAVPGSHLSEQHPGARRDGALFRGHGTSQAAAITGAAVALLLEQHPGLTPDQVKAALTRGARRLSLLPNPAMGAGLLTVDAANLLASGPLWGATQTHPVSTGTGSLEESRGSVHITNAARDQLLVGEHDIHGQPFDSAAWAAAATAGTTWTDGVWNGTAWTGTGWTTTPWGGTAWQGNGWDGNGWDGNGWDGNGWDGNGWDGNGWDGNGWDGNGWDGNGWDGNGWDSVAWDGNGWDGNGWDGNGWDGNGWDGIRWD